MKIKFMNLLLVIMIFGCAGTEEKNLVNPKLKVVENKRYLETRDGEPFFWLGGTSWGMTEWLTREEIDLYLDNRKQKGFNLVQICLLWGKRREDPETNFIANEPNAYGFRHFVSNQDQIDVTRPLIEPGGTANDPNDYWDHVEYALKAAEDRNMIVALLPVWGRRYVNATHKPHEKALFSPAAMKSYGRFLGKRFGQYEHIIWVMGGDVEADNGGDFKGHYRAMAEGIIHGSTGQEIAWNEASPFWDHALMTYHPDGTPMRNSSTWFHEDAWLDFNMIETWANVDYVFAAVKQDYELKPIKPTVMAEPGYEGLQGGRYNGAIDMRRQAYQSYFSGAAGFTYGAEMDSLGNGPLFSPYGNWQSMLDLPGAMAMTYVKEFCLAHDWPHWTPLFNVFTDAGEGHFRKVAIKNDKQNQVLVYFPQTGTTDVQLNDITDAREFELQWFNPADGSYLSTESVSKSESGLTITSPENLNDAVAIINW